MIGILVEQDPDELPKTLKEILGGSMATKTKKETPKKKAPKSKLAEANNLKPKIDPEEEIEVEIDEIPIADEEPTNEPANSVKKCGSCGALNRVMNNPPKTPHGRVAICGRCHTQL